MSAATRVNPPASASVMTAKPCSEFECEARDQKQEWGEKRAQDHSDSCRQQQADQQIHPAEAPSATELMIEIE
jgi:hypothetical protein